MSTDSVRVNVTLDKDQLAEIEFLPLGDGDWSARVAIMLPEGLKLIQMGIPSYPDDLNVMGLILSVVSRLPQEAFVGPVSTPDMARRQPRSLPEVQAGKSQLRHNRPAFWRRQSEQHGDHPGG